MRKSQPVTCRAGTKRRIEGKHSRLQLFNAHTVFRTGQLAAESLFIVVVIVVSYDVNKAFAMSHGQLACLRNSAFLTGFYHNSVYYNLDVMLEGFFQLDFFFIDKPYLSVYPYSGKTFFSNSLQNLFVLAFSSPYNRCQHHEFSTFWKFHYGVYHLVYRLTSYQFAAYRTMGFANSGI